MERPCAVYPLGETKGKKIISAPAAADATPPTTQSGLVGAAINPTLTQWGQWSSSAGHPGPVVRDITPSAVQYRQEFESDWR